ncbi:MAG: helix-turn-helix domain-containing protein, partial [Chloroflexi bacterium]|nr:helix-turn-helix domain-containing protein [Chloroflexota bacterium]
GFTLKELAGRAGLSLSYVSDLEHGRSRPSLQTLERLAEALGVSRAVLLGEEPLEPGPTAFGYESAPGVASPAEPRLGPPSRERALDAGGEALYPGNPWIERTDRSSAQKVARAGAAAGLSARARLAVAEALQALFADPEFGPEISPSWRQLMTRLGLELAETAGRALTKRELLEVYLVMRRVAGDRDR